MAQIEIKNGDIIRFKNDSLLEGRDWVAIHYTNCDMRKRRKHNKHNRNHTGYYLFSGLWYEGNILSDAPYGKCIERLEAGMFSNIKIVGNVSDNVKHNIY